MIVRVLSENQYEIDSKYLDDLNELDKCMVDHLNSEKISEFDRCLHEMIRIIREKGVPLDPAEIRPSDLIVPSPDITPDEARKLFAEEGLTPSKSVRP